MRTLLTIAISILSITSAKSQTLFNTFVYGKLVGEKDTIIGYFQFENSLSSMGQKIRYKDDRGKLFSKPYWSRDFHYFESDSIFLATCDISTATGEIYVMLPRIINGKLQVFEYSFGGGPMGLIKMQHYYFIRDELSTSKVTKKNFDKIMPFIIFDRPDLLSRIKAGELTFKDIKQIILLYNATAAEPSS